MPGSGARGLSAHSCNCFGRGLCKAAFTTVMLMAVSKHRVESLWPMLQLEGWCSRMQVAECTMLHLLSSFFSLQE